MRGGVVGIAAGVFALMGLAMLMHGIAWLLNDLFFDDDVWLGFLIEALFWFLIGRVAGSSPTARSRPARRRPPTSRSRRRSGSGRRSRAARRPTSGEPEPPAALARRRLVSDDAEIEVSGGERGYVSGAGEPVARRATGAPGRSSAEIRSDIERQREQLGHSVEALRNRVTELTDWRRQVREHRTEIDHRRRDRRLRRRRPAGAAPPALRDASRGLGSCSSCCATATGHLHPVGGEATELGHDEAVEVA